MATMTNRFTLLCLIVLILGLVPLATFTCQREAKSTGSPTNPQGKAAASQASAPANAETSEETGMNRRTRPSQPPVEKVYPKPQPPVAEPVKDKPGYVVSPFNGKMIDVREIPSGSMVMDPTF